MLLRMLATRNIPVPESIDVMLVDQEVMADDRTAVEADVQVRFFFVVYRRYGLVGPRSKGKSTLLRMLAARNIPVPESIDVMLVEQEVMADTRTAVEAVVQVRFFFVVYRRYGLVGPSSEGKSTLLRMLAAREIPVPESIDVMLVEQEVMAGDRTAVEAAVRVRFLLCLLPFCLFPQHCIENSC
jgi:ATPase subunit of ABC transporter with duplicated ATPase domains